MTNQPHLHQLAELVGATLLGEPAQFIFSEDQLRRFVHLASVTGMLELCTLADRLERQGLKKVDLLV